jgi:ABC-2 type transport system ATP-binding protein
MLLRTEHLTKDYGRFRALDDLGFSVRAGEVFGLLGPNGSGKTTALRILLGFLQPTAGNAWIAGHDCWHDSIAARRHVAYLPGELRLYENMTGRQLVRFLGQLRGQQVASVVPRSPDRGTVGRPCHNGGDSEVDSLADRLDIDLDRPIAQLSSGMKRKVALLQVLVPRAPLLILDEPTNTLDPTMRDELLAQLREARNQGQTVLFSSHVLTEVEQVCDRVAILQRGRLAHLQEMAALQQSRLIRARLAPHAAECSPDLPGLQLRERCQDQVTLEYTGPLAPLLGWLARQLLADLRLEPLGLAAIYHRFHGTKA